MAFRLPNNHDNSVVFTEQFRSQITTRLQNQMIDEPGDFGNNRSLVNTLDSIVEAVSCKDEGAGFGFTPSKTGSIRNNHDEEIDDREEEALQNRIKHLESQLAQYQSRIVHLKSSLDVTRQLDQSVYKGTPCHTHTMAITTNHINILTLMPFFCLFFDFLDVPSMEEVVEVLNRICSKVDEVLD
jgi:hypothetical protein